MNKENNKNRIAIIVPVFNEEAIIGKVLDDLIITAKEIKADVFIINDGSTDGTLKIVKTFDKKISVINYKKNKGKGYALRFGTDKVHKKYDIVVWMDGDGQLISSDIKKMLSILSDKTEMIISNRKINFKVLPTSKIGRGTVRFLFNFLFKSKIKDHLSGLRVFRSYIYPKIRWISNDYRIEVETLARAVVNNVKYKEVQTVCKKKLYRGIGWRDGLKIYYWIFWCFFNKKKLKIK
jgi:glycosyltransferase involved in cell wall biosynthesis